jgi:uncharacterized membrane protein YbhN (UPF0104 family)
VRPLAGVAILGLLGWRVGVGPFVDGLRHLDAWALLAATAIAAVTTVCGAWRWVLVARGLGVELPLRAAVAECYRSQFLNVCLPGGVLGDVRRGVRHGRDNGDLGRGLRSVVWERSAGQAVLGGVTLLVVLVLPSPLASASVGAGAGGPAVDGSSGGLPSVPMASALVGLGCLVALGLVAFAIWRRWRRPGLPSRVVRALVGDVRAGVLGRHTWPGVVVASGVVVTGHVATFVVAARSAGVGAPSLSLLPLALLVLVAMSLPLNVAGWGPREGAAAWAFGAAGLGAAAGVGTAVVYGVMSLVASLPGAVLLLASRRRRALIGSTLEVEGAARG